MTSARTFLLTPIASTGERFSDFGVYVAAVDDSGTVAFQATLRDGGTGVFTGRGGPARVVEERSSTLARRFYSHPALNDAGALCVYAELAAGGRALCCTRPERRPRSPAPAMRWPALVRSARR